MGLTTEPGSGSHGLTRRRLPDEIRGSDRLAHADGVLSERVGPEGILVDTRAEQIHVLNESAARLWELCATPVAVDDLLTQFAASYGKRPGEVQDDVCAVLCDLRARGLLSADESGS